MIFSKNTYFSTADGLCVSLQKPSESKREAVLWYAKRAAFIFQQPSFYNAKGQLLFFH